MKEDLANKIRETKREMKRTTDLQLAGTTKRTIAENEQMLGELRYQARESAAIETRRAAFAADARAADATTRLCLREEKDIAMYNRTLANELKRLEKRLRAEHAAARVEREVEDAEAAEAKKQTKKQTKSGAALVSARKKEKGPFERRDERRRGRTRSRVARRAPPRSATRRSRRSRRSRRRRKRAAREDTKPEVRGKTSSRFCAPAFQTWTSSTAPRAPRRRGGDGASSTPHSRLRAEPGAGVARKCSRRCSHRKTSAYRA